MLFNKPYLDFGKQSKLALSMQLENALKLYGIKAQIFRSATYNNGYDNPYNTDPEFTQAPIDSGFCYVMLSQPFEGLILSDFISLSDKVDTQIHVTTNTELFINDQLAITFPDNKRLNLRIVENWQFHALSTNVAYKYTAIVT
jgi:hypothetical protein